MFLFPFSYSWLKEWKLRADREERKKHTDKKIEEGSNGKEQIKLYITVILLFKNKSLFLNITTSVDLECVLSILMLAFWVQTQTGTVESWTPRKERTCVTLCSSPDPPELARRLQSTLVRRSWASRYTAGKKRDCDAR